MRRLKKVGLFLLLILTVVAAGCTPKSTTLERLILPVTVQEIALSECKQIEFSVEPEGAGLTEIEFVSEHPEIVSFQRDETSQKTGILEGKRVGTAYVYLRHSPSGVISDKLKITVRDREKERWQAKANEVITAIQAIGVISKDSEAAILAARNGYDVLSEEAKALVTNYGVLLEAERAFQAIKDAGEGAFSSTQNTVYWTAGGEKYHLSKDCSSLKRSKSILSGTITEAKHSGKTTSCKLCG